MNPGLPLGSLPARAWLPEAVVNSYAAPRQNPIPFCDAFLIV